MVVRPPVRRALLRPDRGPRRPRRPAARELGRRHLLQALRAADLDIVRVRLRVLRQLHAASPQHHLELRRRQVSHGRDVPAVALKRRRSHHARTPARGEGRRQGLGGRRRVRQRRLGRRGPPGCPRRRLALLHQPQRVQRAHAHRQPAHRLVLRVEHLQRLARPVHAGLQQPLQVDERLAHALVGLCISHREVHVRVLLLRRRQRARERPPCAVVLRHRDGVLPIEAQSVAAPAHHRRRLQRSFLHLQRLDPHREPPRHRAGLRRQDEVLHPQHQVHRVRCCHGATTSCVAASRHRRSSTCQFRHGHLHKAL